MTLFRSLVVATVSHLLVGCSNDSSYDHGLTVDDSQWALANQQADLAMLIDAAREIEAWHAREQTGIQLNPAVSDQEYLELVSEFPCSPPEEVEALWKWKNGESTDRFVWYHGFLSLQEALEEYRYLTSEPIFGWEETWIPVFQFQDEWNVVVCDSEPNVGAPVIHYFTESGPSYAYTNLTTYLRTMAAAMDRGALTWTDGWWSSSDEVKDLAAIHDEHNDVAKFPYAVE